jgi:ligand-binding sensor domain-containing protein
MSTDFVAFELRLKRSDYDADCKQKEVAMRRQLYSVGVALFVVLNVHAADSWRQVSKQSQPLLPGNMIQLVKQGRDKGVLWIGTMDGLARIENGVISRPEQVAKIKPVWDVTETSDGGFWVGHSKGAVLVKNQKAVSTLKGRSVPLILPVGARLWAIAKDASDANTIMQADGETWKPLKQFEGVRVENMTPGAKGSVLVRLEADGVIEVTVDSKGMPVMKHHLAGVKVECVMTDSKGRTWCGLTDGGVMVLQKGKWVRHLAKESSPVMAIAEDKKGGIWAATASHGIWMFDAKKWKGSLKDDGSSLLQVTSDGRVWISRKSTSGLQYWNGKKWKVSLADSGPISSLVELQEGVLVAGSVLRGIYILGDYNIKGK